MTITALRVNNVEIFVLVSRQGDIYNNEDPSRMNTYNLTPRDSTALPASHIIAMRHSMDNTQLQIRERVGNGGYGTVFRASMGDTDVILKTMMKTPSRSMEEIARKEYNFGMKLKHPNLVRMRGSFDTDTDHCLVMDVVEGCNLFDFLQKNSFGPFGESRVKKMFKGLARGLEHSHIQGIAHLDIKPENIMVGKDDHLTLIDFGLAAHTLGLCHQFKGSPDYASPEVWRNMPFEPACSDVWSLGIVLHILLTGCLPFDPVKVPHMRVQPDLYWPEDIDVSDDVKELVQWMLELKPLARPTMREVLSHRWLKRSLSTIIKRRWSIGGKIELSTRETLARVSIIPRSSLGPNSDPNFDIQELPSGVDPRITMEIFQSAMRQIDNNKLQIRERVGKGKTKVQNVWLTGIGGFGTVFRASMGETDVILKKMLKTPSRSMEPIARKEYDFGMKLKHPNLVRMRGSFDTITDHCLVMDLVEGCNLFDFLGANSYGHFAESRVKKMFKGLARGLEHSHKQGIAHLDIKPENIMVGKDDHLTLIDFGLAAHTLGLCHQFKGSADYASPEVWRNLPFEPASSDVWSLGIVLHILLTGCLPFDPTEVPSMRVQPDLYWPEDIDVSDDAKELVQWMLELKPMARPTMKEKDKAFDPMDLHDYIHGNRKGVMRQIDNNQLQIRERVGRGGYGTVFRASMGETDVILKKMLKTPSRSTEGVARKEFDFGMKLKHPNLVRMRGSFDTDTDHCLVMDVVEGCNLFDFLQKNSFGPFGESRVKKMFKGLARGLEHSHRQGIAHLDIKPENIMVGKDDHLTLIDFGLAAETLGLCHQFSGSADYASPEVWRNMPFEPACADVWSLGIVLHILLTGCLPFDPTEVPHMRVQPDLYWPEDIDVSDDAKELVGWMLELKPMARPTMKEVLNHRWLKRSLSTIIKRRWSIGGKNELSSRN
ncbi:MAP/microtubule affinity-regulating kinase 3-like [Planoprotostelium fungivorum]|uniref:MAP/microtubule affinity-regulating kinase 3-like n=1 Tax=Planoprotostelium fungivorum TaxID=1890364 RepID=A0A2P6NBH4_9EUKA|nr:MAP/microtubule affinity-regulating kinase 3-like [Planoprotostelium fungivorum]